MFIWDRSAIYELYENTFLYSFSSYSLKQEGKTLKILSAFLFFLPCGFYYIETLLSPKTASCGIKIFAPLLLFRFQISNLALC